MGTNDPQQLLWGKGDLEKSARAIVGDLDRENPDGFLTPFFPPSLSPFLPLLKQSLTVWPWLAGLKLLM